MHTTEQLNSALAGRYTIERRIGEGGMATVYLARDVRHNRKVALKVLKPDLGAIVGLERFLSEIEVTANLQHPNLLPLFDSGAADGLLFYVMPYVEGESLRARLDREKQLPVDEAVRIAAAVAGALDYAHRRGVIHRDLKPENILLHDGQPLVADFGIALAVSNAGGDRVTQTGLSLGTPRYMSPEQATGDRAVDARTDIYSLGAVTYELLTGEPPHTGATSQAIIARVLTERPRGIRASRPSVAPQVEATVLRALEKLAADRFDSVREFADALTGKVTIAPTTTETPAVSVGAAKRERLLVATTAVAIAGAAVMGMMLAMAPEPPPAPQIRFDFETPRALGPLQISISPDGQTILFNGYIDASRSAIFARPLARATAAPLPAALGASGPTFWKPDSREFAYVHDGVLQRMTVVDGVSQAIPGVTQVGGGGTWNASDTLVIAREGAVFRVAASGGEPERINLTTTDSLSWSWPWFLPDGRHFLVLGRGRSESASGIYVASLEGGSPVRVMPATSRAVFSPPNLILFARDEVLYAQTLDLKRFQVFGDPVRIADEVGVNVNNGAMGATVSATGTLVIRDEAASETRQLTWFSRTGTRLGSLGRPDPIREFALSPDGSTVAFSKSGSGTGSVTSEIWIVDRASNVTSRLTMRTDNGISGVLWSPDSRSVTYRVGVAGTDSILVRSLGTATDSMRFTGSVTSTAAEAYQPDGKSLLLRRGARVFSMDVGGSGEPRELASFTGLSDQFRVSPDGRFVSWNTLESGTWQVWVASYPSFENRRQVSAQGGVQARWHGDSRELYFLSLDGKVMAATIVPGPTPVFNAPTELFASSELFANVAPSGNLDQYDVTKDGQRFLFGVLVANAVQAPRLTVLVNWTNALRKP